MEFLLSKLNKTFKFFTASPGSPKKLCLEIILIPSFRHELSKSSAVDAKTSSTDCKIAIRVHLNFFISAIRVGLWIVADGCVRNIVGNLARLESAGLLAPYERTTRFHSGAASAAWVVTKLHPAISIKIVSFSSNSNSYITLDPRPGSH